MPPTHSLTELAQRADVTVRTIRYYIAQGLLSSPSSVGPGARYQEGHLLRLRLIKQLQREHLPLAEIRTRLAGLSDEEVRTLLDERAVTRVSEPAIDYIRGVLGGGTAHPTTYAIAMQPMAAAGPPPRTRAYVSASAAEAVRDVSGAAPDRSQWDRITLAPDVELHVRRPLSRIQNKRVERLIALGRELFEEDQP